MYVYICTLYNTYISLDKCSITVKLKNLDSASTLLRSSEVRRKDTVVFTWWAVCPNPVHFYYQISKWRNDISLLGRAFCVLHCKLPRTN